ncbi:hypothetical protein ASPFODRAFT_402849 [Aspergillus luchuensis CBS 106.47]|uniref:Uncharacterized protein n=1 Tax=Aspergillus luchuensis (strain CBS 106.47) TaxID=1137211 RepID=A0A1M3T1L5_ASPLC|nr:hypothetical protein ASPFODRAFT_402849 [Aspergillus luchuensis CBS 106.47]
MSSYLVVCHQRPPSSVCRTRIDICCDLMAVASHLDSTIRNLRTNIYIDVSVKMIRSTNRIFNYLLLVEVVSTSNMFLLCSTFKGYSRYPFPRLEAL